MLRACAACSLNGPVGWLGKYCRCGNATGDDTFEPNGRRQNISTTAGMGTTVEIDGSSKDLYLHPDPEMMLWAFCTVH